VIAIAYAVIGLALAAALIVVQILKPGDERARWRDDDKS
jgi:hypothetical protein